MEHKAVQQTSGPWDRRETSAKRMDAFTDSAFAFAITLVVFDTGGIPNSVTELQNALLQLPASLASLAFLMGFWLEHRRFGSLVTVRDRLVDAISLGIVIAVLVFVLPLALLSDSIAHWISDASLPGHGLRQHELRHLYAAYGAGFGVLSATFLILYRYASARPVALAIAPHIAPRLRRRAMFWAMAGATGALSAILAMHVAPAILPWAPGAIYLSLIPAYLTVATIEKRIRRSEARAMDDTI